MPTLFEFPITINGDEGLKESMHSALLPHEVFHTIYHEAPLLFRKLFTGGEENLQRWWSGAEKLNDHWYRQHPVIQKVKDPRLRVPIGLHGDDAGAHGLQQVLVLTWGSVAVDLPTLDSRLVFCMIRVADIVKDDADSTLQTIYKVHWSCMAHSKQATANNKQH